MATEKRLIDANALKKEIVDFKLNLHPQNQVYGTGCFSALSVVEGMLAYAPTVDAVEVVRCKNCEFWNDGWFPECTMGKCRRGKPVLTEPHHYCSYGVRRLDVPVIIKDESFVVKEETEK